MEKKMKETEVKMYVNKMYKKLGKLISEEQDVETVFVARLEENAAYVTISKSLKATHNMGDFNSAGIEVFMSAPCPQDKEQIELGYEYISGIIKDKVIEETSNIHEERASFYESRKKK